MQRQIEPKIQILGKYCLSLSSRDNNLCNSSNNSNKITNIINRINKNKSSKSFNQEIKANCRGPHPDKMKLAHQGNPRPGKSGRMSQPPSNKIQISHLVTVKVKFAGHLQSSNQRLNGPLRNLQWLNTSKSSDLKLLLSSKNRAVPTSLSCLANDKSSVKIVIKFAMRTSSAQ